MPTYDNKNSFVLFQNRSVNPKAPNFSGTYTDQNGKEWEIIAWTKTSKNGNEFLSGKIKEKGQKNSGKKFSTPSQNQRYSEEDIDF